jgi:hypothetical protein
VESSVASCADTGLVALTDYTYTVVASLGANWHSAAGTASASTVPTFSLALEAGPYVAGAPVTVTSLTAVFGGSTDIGYSGTKTINWTGLGDGPSGQSPSYPSSSVTFVDGVATPGSFITFAAGATTLGATDAAFSSATGSAPLTLNPGAATKMAVTTQPTGAVDGVAFTTQPVVTIQDANGNTVTDSNASVTLAVASGSGTLACTTNPVQAAIGVATFDGCALTGTLGDYTLTASATDLTDADTSNIALAIGVAAQVVVNTMVDSTDGATLATQPVATIEDIGGNTVTSATDAVTLHASSGTLACDQNSVDAVAGTATFAGCSLTGQTGAHTLSASVEGLPAGDSNSFVLMTGSATQLAVTTQPDGAADGGAFTTQPVITIEDVGGNTISDSSASVTLAASAGTLACTDNPVIASNGIATFDGCSLTGIIGEYTLTASATDLTSATTDSFVLAHGAAAKLAVSVQPNGAASGAAFTTQPVVTVQDASGNTVTDSSASVSLAVDSGSGTMACTDISVTATNGIASFDGCAITGTIGNYTLTASATDLTSATTDSLALTHGAATHLAVTTQPSGAANAAAFSTQPVITVLDSAGNTVTDSSDSVTLASSAGSLACSDASVNATNGIANFAGCKITGTIGAYTLTASAVDLTSATTDSFTLGFGAATHLAVTTQPNGAANGVALTTQPVVTVLDSAGNTVTDSSANVTLAVATGSGTLACTDASVTPTNGIATFAGCKITGTVGSYTLTATSGSLASATTDSFTLAHGSATKMAFTTQPGGAANGVAFTTQPVVTVQDASGNTVTGSSASVSLASSAGTLACTGNPVNATNGVATFRGCSLTGIIGLYTLTATSGSLTSTTTNSITLTYGAAAKLMVTVQPSGAVNGEAFTTQPVITVLDSANNIVTDSNAEVTLAVASGTGSMGCTNAGGLTATASNGIATFTGCSLSGTVGNFTLVASSGSLTSATTSSFSLTAAPPGTPGISAAVSSGSSPVWVDRETVTLTDSLDNAGVASVAYYSCPASAGSCTSNTPWSLIGSSSTGPDWSVSWTSLPADGTYRVVAVATGANATVSAPSSAVQIGIDSNGPTVAAPSVAAAHTSGSSPLTVSNEDLTLTDTSVSDTGSGVKSVSYYYCAGASGACSATLIGTSTTASGNYSVTWAAPLPADGAYRIQAVASDNVTNSTTSSSTPINVDSGAPTVSKPIVNGFQ